MYLQRIYIHICDIYDPTIRVTFLKDKKIRPIMPLYRLFSLSLARLVQAERDNESCFFVSAAGVHQFISTLSCQNIEMR